MSNTELLPIPKNFIINENFGELTIEYKWSRLTGIVVLVFAFIWNGFMLSILSKMPSEIILVITIPGVIGIFMVYFAISHLVNKTIITCDSINLRIKSGPLPAFSNRVIKASDIKQLYFTERVTNGKNGKQVSYHLHMLDYNDRSRKIMRYLPDAETARFLEHRLEKFYKIENKRVEGQHD